MSASKKRSRSSKQSSSAATSTAPAPASTAAPSPPRHSAERYELVEIGRAEIATAEYNPRTITDQARRKLRKAIEKVGLLAPITWNRRTGRIVGGHQRLKALDAINGSKSYTLRVAAVDMSDEEERAANVLLNNPEAQGEWDLERLAEVCKGIDGDAAGLDEADLFRILGDQASDDVLEEVAKRVEKLREADDAAKEADGDQHSTDFYLVTFATSADRKAFTALLGLDDNRYQHGGQMLAALREKLGAEG